MSSRQTVTLVTVEKMLSREKAPVLLKAFPPDERRFLEKTDAPGEIREAQTESPVAMAAIDPGEFELARTMVGGFAQWATSEDSLLEREGLRMGLASAGIAVNLVPISISSFVNWSLHAGIPANTECFDDFAALLQTFQQHPQIAVEGIPFLAQRNEHWRHDVDRGVLIINVNLDHYHDWRTRFAPVCDFTVNAYARQLLQIWAEYSEDTRTSPDTKLSGRPLQE